MFTAWFNAGAQNISTVKEYKKVFRTYGFSDPDPIAKMGSIYPYYRFDGYTNIPTDKEWKVVELENDFIKLMILPEIGGKIWGAWEKASGRPFLYYNQVVKFRDVAMRGPWTSGGIEANYGIIGHTPNCATPVDYMTKVNDDKSVSCYIGTLDLLTQTYWTIEINLPNDKAYFTTRSFWHNSTPIEQPYYTWMNAGIKAGGELEFIYPGTKYIGHEGEYADWNINKANGKNISFYGQNDFGGYKSYHVFGKYTDFFGAYWHRDNFGMARYAPHDEKPGKKIWIWGLSPQGMIWEKLLSDTDGQYVEVQSGRLFNQASPGSTFTPFKHTGFTPSTSDSWTEYWFPVMKTGGFVKANQFGALNIRQQNGYLRMSISGVQTMKDSLQVFEGARLIYKKEIALRPLSVFTDSLLFNGDTNNLTIMLGAHKMQYRTDPNDKILARPIDSPHDFDWNSAYGLYIQGEEDLHQRLYVTAEEKLRKCLEKDSNYLPALSAMSMLMLRNMEYDKALAYARHGLSIDTYDPRSNYYYAQSNLQLGHKTDAKDGFGIAALSTEYRGASFTGMSKLFFSEGDLDNAITYARKALEVNINNTEAEQVIATTYRIRGEKDKAGESLARLTRINPLNHFIRFEQYLLQPSDATKAAFKSMIRNELTTETYLQLADWYYSLGRTDESLAALLLAPENPEVYYWIAFLKSKLSHADAASYIEKADALSSQLIFPFRQNSAAVLQWVIDHSSSWKPKYYLSLVYWTRNNLEKAKAVFNQCGNPDYAPFYAAKASLFADQNYTAYIRRAAELDPKEWRYGKLLVNRLGEEKKTEEALTAAREYNKKFPNDFRISMVFAKALLLTKHYKETSDLLEKTSILPNEGSTDGRRLYREAWMMQAIDQLKRNKFRDASSSVEKSRQWPEHLGVGKPYDSDIDDRAETFVEGLINEKAKGSTSAQKYWTSVVGFDTTTSGPNLLLVALAYKKLGRSEEGERILDAWVKKDPNNKTAAWCLDAFHGNIAPIPGDLIDNDSLRLVSEIISISYSR